MGMGGHVLGNLENGDVHDMERSSCLGSTHWGVNIKRGYFPGDGLGMS